MTILIVVIIILALTGGAAFLNRFTPFRICPLCAGVSGTWLILNALMLNGILSATDYLLPNAILMGGTVVGIGYQGEKRFPILGKHLMWFRVPTTVVGLIAAYAAVRYMSWGTFIAEIAVLAVIMYMYFLLPPGDKKTFGSVSEAGKHLAELEEKMKDCC